MSHTSPVCWSGKQETELAVQLPRMRPGWTRPLHPQNKPTQAPEQCEQFCPVLMKFSICVSPKLNCRTRLPALVIKWPEIQHDHLPEQLVHWRWETLLPGCWARASSRSPGPSTHSLHTELLLPSPCTASKRLVLFQSCTLTPSSTYLFFICIIKKRFQRPGTSKRGENNETSFPRN